MRHIYPYFTCFITGIIVLVLEITSLRLLAPSFGNSIFMTGIVINCVLFGLAVGYYLGGKIGDKKKIEVPAAEAYGERGANHSLAGMDLTFDVELTASREATTEEISHGHAHGEHGHSH